MTDRDEMARDIGGALDESLGEGPGASALEMHKRILAASTGGKVRAGSNRRIGMLAAVVGLAASVALVAGVFAMKSVFEEGDPSAQRFRIGNSQIFAQPGSFARSEPGSRVPIVFENGSRFDLVDRSEARIAEAAPERVVVHLGSGRVDSWVNGDGATSWIVRAGPYTVTVLGTVFSVLWNEDEGELEVRVREGSVRVGDEKARSDVTLQAGYALVANSVNGEKVIRELSSDPVPEGAKRVAVSDDSELEKSNEGLESGDNSSPDRSVAIKESGEKDASRNAARSAGKDTAQEKTPESSTETGWQTACQARRYQDAIREASARDIAEMENVSDLETLWRLAKAARYLKKNDDSIRLFRAIRTRFPSTGRARTAAFLIGKTVLELQGDRLGAEPWFELYLKEAKNGSLAEESLGHLMDIYVATAQGDKAARAANSYLERYPAGVFSKRAEEIISR